MQPKVFEIDPVPKPRQTNADRWKVGANARPTVARYRAFCDNLRLQAGSWQLPDSFAVTFTVQMPKSWSKKKKAQMDGKPAQSKPDLSNLVKSLEDAMRDDDEKVHMISAKKIWGDRGKIVVFPITNILFQVEQPDESVSKNPPHQKLVATQPAVVPTSGGIRVNNPLDIKTISPVGRRPDTNTKNRKKTTDAGRAGADQKIS